MKHQPIIQEFWLHYLWKNEKFADHELSDTEGRTIKILSTGWYNRGWGPDFKDAKIMAGKDEFFGDIEIHIDESAWCQHGHHQDSIPRGLDAHAYGDGMAEGPQPQEPVSVRTWVFFGAEQ